MQLDNLSQLSNELYQIILKYVKIKDIFYLQQASTQLKINKSISNSIYDLVKESQFEGNVLVYGQSEDKKFIKYFFVAGISMSHLYIENSIDYWDIENSEEKHNKFTLDDKEIIAIEYCANGNDDYDYSIIITINQYYEYCVYEFKSVLSDYEAHDQSNSDALLCCKKKYNNINNLQIYSNLQDNTINILKNKILEI